MGEIDLIKICPDPAMTGGQYAVLTVLVTWLPLAIVGFVLRRRVDVRAAMRGAGPLRLLARFAIAVQLGAIAFAVLTLAVGMDAIWRDYTPWGDVIAILVLASCVLLPVIAIGTGGIIAWHRVLVALASREGEGRMLV